MANEPNNPFEDFIDQIDINLPDGPDETPNMDDAGNSHIVMNREGYVEFTLNPEDVIPLRDPSELPDAIEDFMNNAPPPTNLDAWDEVLWPLERMVSDELAPQIARRVFRTLYRKAFSGWRDEQIEMMIRMVGHIYLAAYRDLIQNGFHDTIGDDDDDNQFMPF